MVRIELTAMEANILYKYLRAADSHYEELENVGDEQTSDMECHVINSIEKQISDYFGGIRD